MHHGQGVRGPEGARFISFHTLHAPLAPSLPSYASTPFLDIFPPKPSSQPSLQVPFQPSLPALLHSPFPAPPPSYSPRCHTKHKSMLTRSLESPSLVPKAPDTYPLSTLLSLCQAPLQQSRSIKNNVFLLSLNCGIKAYELLTSGSARVCCVLHLPPSPLLSPTPPSLHTSRLSVSRLGGM